MSPEEIDEVNEHLWAEIDEIKEKTGYNDYCSSSTGHKWTLLGYLLNLKQRAEAAEAKLRELEWRPIETHPKGQPGFIATDDEMSAIEWLVDLGDEDFFNINSGNYTKTRHWTHWIPLYTKPFSAPKQEDK